MSVAAASHVIALLAAVSASFGVSLDACDAGELEQAFTDTQLNTQELLRICQERYSEGICRATSHALSSSLSVESQKGSVSLPKIASLACSALEATLLQQRALLLRQSRGQSANSVGGREEKIDRLDSGLTHKNIPFPHGTFVWEYYTQSKASSDSNVTTTASGPSLPEQVENFETELKSRVNESSPEVADRALAFTSFVTTSTAGPSNASALQVTAEKAVTNSVVDSLKALAPSSLRSIAKELGSTEDDLKHLGGTEDQTDALIHRIVPPAAVPASAEPSAATAQRAAETVTHREAAPTLAVVRQVTIAEAVASQRKLESLRQVRLKMPRSSSVASDTSEGSETAKTSEATELDSLVDEIMGQSVNL